MKKLKHCLVIIGVAAIVAATAFPVCHASNINDLPREARHSLYYAQQAMQQDSYNKARSILNTYLKENSGEPYAEIYLLIGNTWFHENNMEEAQKVYKKGITVLPNDMALHLNYAIACYQNEQYELSGDHFVRAYNLQPEDVIISDLTLLYKGATAYYHGEHYSAAENTLNRLIREADEPEKDWLELLVHTQMNQTNWAAAEKSLYQLLDLTPTAAGYWELLAQIHINRKQYKKAAPALEIAYWAKSPDSKSWKNLADLYRYINAPLKAAECLKKSFGRQTTAEQKELMADIYARALRFDLSLDYIQKAIAQEESADRYLKMGTYLYRNLQISDATAAFEQCLSLDPDQSTAALMMGFCAIDLKDWRLARRAFSRAAKSEKYRSWAESSLTIVEDLIAAEETAKQFKISMNMLR